MKREEFKRDLMKKTIRNKQPNLIDNNLHINLELPDELKEDYYINQLIHALRFKVRIDLYVFTY